MGVFSRIFNKGAQVSLVREEQVFYVLAYYDGELTPIADVAEKWPDLLRIARRVANPHALRNAVPIDQFDAMRSLIRSTRRACEKKKKLGFYLSTDVENAQICDQAPEDFVICYRRQSAALVRVLPDGVVELEDGWLHCQNVYWRYENYTASAQKFVRQRTIEEQDLVEFAASALPAYRAAGIPIRSDIEYDRNAVFHLQLTVCAEDRVKIQTVWHVPPEAMDESVHLEDHVLADGLIRPGLTPSAMRAVLPEEVTALEGVRLAAFLDMHYPSLKKWFRSDMMHFERIHQWVKRPYHWELVARSKQTRGIGKAYAHPVACIGEDCFSLDELKEMLRLPYARISDGWVRKADLLTLGMNENGVCASGGKFAPIPLRAEQLLYRGGSELGTRWSAMRCEGAEWTDEGSNHVLARKHLEYLTHWGVNGGLLGGYEAMVSYGIPLLIRLGKNEKSCKILVMGRREDIRELRNSYGDLLEHAMSKQVFYCLDYDAVFYNDVLRAKRWDLLLLIEPDVYANPTEQTRMAASMGVSAACRIGFFFKRPDAQTRQWDAQQLKCRNDASLMEYLIRDSRNPGSLPPAYTFHPKTIQPALPVLENDAINRSVVFRKLHDNSAEAAMSEVEDQGPAISGRREALHAQLIRILKGLVVSARGEGQVPAMADEPGRVQAETDDASPNKAFFREARERADYKEAAAAQIPIFGVVFRKMEDGSAEAAMPGERDKGITVPARGEAQAPSLLHASGWEQAEMHDSSPNKAFFQEARRLADYEEAAAAHVPFFCYWPKYSDMDPSQRKWYFFLRAELRRGQFPETDLSYLFVYVYEVLNLIGVKNAAEGLKTLLSIQQAYGERYPRLQNYLTSWICDFVHLYDCDISARQIGGSLPDLPEWALNELLTGMAEEETLHIPMWALERLSSYKISGSKFYQRGYQDLMNRCIPGALQEIDRQLRQKKGKNLLNTYAALKIHADQVTAFTGALCERMQSYTLKCRHYQNGLRFREYLKNVVRYTENGLRAIMKYSAKLQGVELDEQSKAWIDAYLASAVQTRAAEPSAIRIRLDLKKLDQLRADSDDVREALIASMGEEEPTGTPAMGIERPEDTAEGLLTDLDAVQGILTQLTQEQSGMLRSLQTNGWQLDEAELKTAAPHLFLEASVDEINEGAMARLGCFLIEREGDSFIVAEDYRDELEYLMPRQQAQQGWFVSLEGVDDEWKAFFAQTDSQLLGAFLEGKEAVRDYAKRRGDMPDLLLDDINNIAMDTIGDLLIAGEGISEEYLPIIKNHLKKG